MLFKGKGELMEFRIERQIGPTIKNYKDEDLKIAQTFAEKGLTINLSHE